MKQNTSGIDRDFIISFFLPDGMIDWFELVNMKEENNPGTTIADKLYGKKTLHFLYSNLFSIVVSCLFQAAEGIE